MPLPKQGEKKFCFGNCGNGIAKNGKLKKKNGYEIYESVKKKNVVMSIIFLQYFNNKSHVINYYQLKKFVTN